MGYAEDGIRELITERYGSVPKLAEAIGIPAQTIYSALRNGLAGASATTMIPIAFALEVDPYELTRGNLVKLANRVSGAVEVPLFGSISAGCPLEPDMAEAMVPIPAELAARHPSSFLLRVDGESMNKVLPNGCYALVDSLDVTTVISNKIYAVAVGEDRVTVKRVRVLANGYELCPDSTDPTYRSTLLDFSDVGEDAVAIVGKVVWYCLPVNWAVFS